MVVLRCRRHSTTIPPSFSPGGIPLPRRGTCPDIRTRVKGYGSGKPYKPRHTPKGVYGLQGRALVRFKPGAGRQIGEPIGGSHKKAEAGAVARRYERIRKMNRSLPDYTGNVKKTYTDDISPLRLRELIALLQNGEEWRFYSWGEWRARRRKVLRLDRYECQRCKERGRYSRAVLVHHVKHLKDRPDLALSIIDPATGERQLVSVCKRCHEELHPESQRQYRPSKPPITAERWD